MQSNLQTLSALSLDNAHPAPLSLSTPAETSTNVLVLHHESAKDELKEEARATFSSWEQASISNNTRRAILSDAKQYTAFLLETYPELADNPENSSYVHCLQWLRSMRESGIALATIRRRWSSLVKYIVPSLQDPAVKKLYSRAIRGLNNQMSRENAGQQRGKKALTITMIEEALAQWEEDPEKPNRMLMERLYLLFSAYSAERRSEVAALRWKHLTFQDKGVHCLIPMSKTDQGAAGQVISIKRRDNVALCPVALLEQWKVQSGGEPNDFVFRRISGKDMLTADCIGEHVMERIVQKVCRVLNLPEGEYGCHSFRRGFVSYHADKGVSLQHVMVQTRHKSERTVQGYVQLSNHNFDIF